MRRVDIILYHPTNDIFFLYVYALISQISFYCYINQGQQYVAVIYTVSYKSLREIRRREKIWLFPRLNSVPCHEPHKYYEFIVDYIYNY